MGTTSAIGPDDRAASFVGRAHELRSLRNAFAETRSGCGRLMLLVGEPGIGKTRTASEFGAEARRAGGIVLWGACYDGEWAPPFGPFAEAIAAYARQCDADTLRTDLGFGAAPVARVVPAVRERLPDLPEPAPLQPDEERFRLFDAVSQFLIAIAKSHAVVLLLDDLHWADKGTIALLRHVARFAPENRVLLVGAYRDVDVDPRHPLADLLGALQRESTYERVTLKGLDHTETADLIAALTRREVADGLVTDIHRQTQGNPFFVREILQHLIEEGSLTDQRVSTLPELTVPEGIRYIVERRLARVSAEANRVLTVAAAFEGPFRYDIAAVVAEVPSPDALAVIDEALRAQLIAPTAHADAYDFSHALIRHTLYRGLSPSRRVRLHRAIAEAMEAVYGDRAAEHAAAIARHYHRSASLPGAERGVPHCLAAADEAERSVAFAEVAGHLQAALDLLPAEAPEHTWLCGRLAIALGWALRFDDAVATARDAAVQLAAAEHSDVAADYLTEVIVALAEAGGAFHAGPPARQGLQYAVRRRDPTWALLKAFDIIARDVENPMALGIPLDTPERREVGSLLGRYAQVAMVWIFLPSTSRVEMMARFGDHGVYFEVGEYRRGAPVERERAANYERMGRLGNAVQKWVSAARLHTALGEFRAAEEARRHAAALHRRLTEASTVTGMLIAAEDDHRLAMDEAWGAPFENAGPEMRGPVLAWYRVAVEAATARTLARMGLSDQAIPWLAKIVPAVERAPGWADNYTRTICDAAETLWLTARDDYIDVIERNLREKVIAPDFHFPMMDGRLALARLCALQGRCDEAVEWFSKARVVLDEQGARPLRAIVDYDEALMYARRGEDSDRERERPLLEAALTQFRRLGMPGWIRRAEHLLATGREWSATTDGVARGAAGVEPPPDPLLGKEGEPEIRDQQPETRDEKPETCGFRCEGDVWSITFAGTTHRIKDSRGLRYLALLFAHPGREFHASEIVALSAAQITPSRSESPEQSPAADLGDAGEMLDATATAQYKRRLDALREELSEAEANNDLGRTAGLRHEMELLISSLASARRGRRGGVARRAGALGRQQAHSRRAQADQRRRSQARPLPRPHHPHRKPLQLPAGAGAADRRAAVIARHRWLMSRVTLIRADRPVPAPAQ